MRTWTEQQRQAINARGGDLLVSAAAGSGKTAVLTERVISLITDKEKPIDIDRLLIVTFSNAAASEMRTRIAERLYELLEESPEDEALRRQTLLLGGASICTIHAFCYQLIRENFQLLGLPGDLRLGDEREMLLLRQKVVSSLLEEEYAKGEEDFLRLVELLSKSRTDQKVQETILTLYDFIRNHPFYEEWVGRLLAENDCAAFDDTVWRRILTEYAAEALENCTARLHRSLDLTHGFSQLEERLAPLLRADILMLEDLRDALHTKDWDTSCAKAQALSFERFPRITDPDCMVEKEKIHNTRKAVSAVAALLKTRVFLMTSQDYTEDERELLPLTRKLFSVVLHFGALFREEKLLRGKLDFSDLEHDALRLLWQDGRRTELAERLSHQYAEILMDEYQDTNELQERIFSAISCGETSRFMVGDVKQSIYRFRQACPEIFLVKKQSFSPYDGESFPAKIALSANFRTRREITGFVNRLFEQIMNPVVGEMKYLPEDALTSRLGYDYSIPRPVTLLALEAPKEWNRAKTVAAEAEYIACEIGRLLAEGFLIGLPGEQHPARPGDFCILMRSVKNKAEVYLSALSRHGLAGRIEQKDGFLSSQEIVPLIAYLRVLQNPMQDLELAKVLMSPMYGCTGDDIAGLRLLDRNKKLYLTMQQTECSGKPCFSSFLEDYSVLRARMQSEPCSRLIREICDLTGYREKCRVLPDGAEALSNLQLLEEYAAEYEQNARGENDFIGYLFRMTECTYDLPAASVGAENAVSIMTIHHSKGLEFPVVFLADTAGEFSGEENRTDICLHRELGFACKLRDNRTMRQHRTLPFAAMQLENRRADLSEEMRILYVALTRPREKLYVVASQSGMIEKIAGAEPLSDAKMPVWQTRRAGSFLDWLLPTFVAAKACTEAELEYRCVPLVDAEIPQTEVQATAEMPPADMELLQNMQDNIRYEYPFGVDTVTQRRYSVSELAEHETHEEFFFSRRPKAVTVEGLSAAEHGTAVHKLMQFANYAALVENPKNEISRLVTEGYLYMEEGDQLDPSAAVGLLHTELGKRLLHAEKVYREIRFLQEFTPQELLAIHPTLAVPGKTMLMGAVDCVFVENGSAVIIDYKTDRVKSAEELLPRYMAQVLLYREIVRRQLGLPVREVYLYSFQKGVAIPVVL